MVSYMCPDCGERVDEEDTVNDKCNYCHHGKYAYGDIQMSDIIEMAIPEDFSNHEKMVLWCWKPEAYFGERKALVKLVLEANE